MSKHFLPLLVLLAALFSCNRTQVQPRPTLPLVHSIAADTAGTGRLAAMAGSIDGSIGIIGEPESAIILARRFQGCDRVDNVDGRPVRDSLPDFAGECFDVIMDAMNAPYAHFWAAAEPMPDTLRFQVLDSLREVAVLNAVCAWDSLSWRSVADAEPILRKQRSKMLIFTSSLHAKWGLFDVDTLQQMVGGHCRVLTPVITLLEDAYAAGARSMAVWTTRDVRNSGTWQSVFETMGYKDATLDVIAPDAALDIRTELRNLLRQYKGTGRVLDALLLDSFTIDTAPLQSELVLIKGGVTAEDASFQAMLSPDFMLLDPASSLIGQTYRLLRKNQGFTHQIGRPAVYYYETEESVDGTPILVETTAAYALSTYVPNLN